MPSWTLHEMHGGPLLQNDVGGSGHHRMRGPVWPYSPTIALESTGEQHSRIRVFTDVLPQEIVLATPPSYVNDTDEDLL